MVVFIKAKKGKVKTWYERATIIMEELYKESMATEVATRGASYNKQHVTELAIRSGGEGGGASRQLVRPQCERAMVEEACKKSVPPIHHLCMVSLMSLVQHSHPTCLAPLRYNFEDIACFFLGQRIVAKILNFTLVPAILL